LFEKVTYSELIIWKFIDAHHLHTTVFSSERPLAPTPQREKLDDYKSRSSCPWISFFSKKKKRERTYEVT
jgi:hypothetical protein